MTASKELNVNGSNDNLETVKMLGLLLDAIHDLTAEVQGLRKDLADREEARSTAVSDAVRQLETQHALDKLR